MLPPCENICRISPPTEQPVLLPDLFRNCPLKETSQHIMQRIPNQFFPALLSILSLISCQDESKTNPDTKITAPTSPDTIRMAPAPVGEGISYSVTEGVVNWLGKRSVGNLHTGTIKVQNGDLLVSRGQLISGTIHLDMTSVSVNNLKDPGAKSDLESHLKDSDFFDVKRHPAGTFKIDEVLPSNLPEFNWVVSGELTLKGKTNRVNIPVKMTISDKEIRAQSANFVINRTQWGINFQSGILGTVKDKVIEDIVPLSLTLSAKRKQ